jgi:hypothetical protein
MYSQRRHGCYDTINETTLGWFSSQFHVPHTSFAAILLRKCYVLLCMNFDDPRNWCGTSAIMDSALDFEGFLRESTTYCRIMVGYGISESGLFIGHINILKGLGVDFKYKEAEPRKIHHFKNCYYNIIY